MDGREVNAFDVDGIDLVELFLAHFEHGAVAVRPARVVDHHIQPAMQAQGFIDQGLDVGGLRHVGLEKRRRTARSHDLGHHALATGLVDVVDDDLATLGGQALGNAFANAVASAGDDDGFVLHAHGVVSWLFKFDSSLRFMDKRLGPFSCIFLPHDARQGYRPVCASTAWLCVAARSSGTARPSGLRR